MEVFPEFALPIMSTLNWTFGTRGGSGGSEARAEAGDRARAGGGAGDGAGDGDGDGGGDGDGARQQILCFRPIARKCSEKRDWETY